jgi:hypothetical protein
VNIKTKIHLKFIYGLSKTENKFDFTPSQYLNNEEEFRLLFNTVPLIYDKRLNVIYPTGYCWVRNFYKFT